jgi:hypothetical protein
MIRVRCLRCFNLEPYCTCDPSRPPGPRYVLHFGSAEAREGILSVETDPGTDGLPTARVILATTALEGVCLDWQSVVRVFAEEGSVLKPLFTGLVDTVTPSRDEITLTFVSVGRTMREFRLGGLGASPSTKPRELIWTLLRSGGFGEEELGNIGFDAEPEEVFEVAVPVDGVVLAKPHTIGNVQLLPAGPVTELAGDLGSDSLRERYRSAKAWASTRCTARTLFDAEAQGLAAIDLVLAWLTASARFSSVALPASQVRAYRRDWTRFRVSRRNVAIVRGGTSGRAWLRAPTDLSDYPTLDLDEIQDLALFELPTSRSPQINEAVLAWRRGAEATFPIATVMAMWEAIGFYVSGVKEPLFTDDERARVKNLCQGAIGEFGQEQQKRVMSKLDGLNDAPLLAQLRIALAEDHVPYTEPEFMLLQSVRKVRNDFGHGESPSLPPSADLRLFVSLVNRMLVHRMSRLASSQARANKPAETRPTDN